MNQQRDEIEIDLRDIFYVLKKRFLIILLTAMVFAAGAGVYSFFIGYNNGMDAFFPKSKSDIW